MSTPQEILKKYWNYDAFRPLQLDIIESVLSGRDTLALLPTGGGKSVCFQVPALVKSAQMVGENKGVCLVISPLIALMKDQVAQLERRNIKAVAIHAGMKYKDVDRILDNAVFGEYRFLYLSPERLQNFMVQERLKRMKITLIAVDEAHCISQWGYDFRPPYLQISEIRAILPPDLPILALTATATPEVVEDIQNKLSFRQKNVFQQNFERQNLSYLVRWTEDKTRKMLEILKKTPTGAGIVYVRSRKATKDVSNLIRQNGMSADFYHAGLDVETRTQKQNDWISGKTRFIVATNAFGMGIDKPDVRVVVHLDVPDTLEAYFQEAGRAGRDGQKSYSVLLVNNTDITNLNGQFRGAFPDLTALRRVYSALCSYFQLAVGAGENESFSFDWTEFSDRFELHVRDVHAALKVLEQDGWLAFTESVFLPSTIEVLLNHEQLYEFQIKNPEKERILKGIARLLGGEIFSFPTQFDEIQLARFLKMSIIDLEKSLHWFHANRILDYRPRTDQPQITFLRPREAQHRLDIDRVRYELRRKQAARRLKSTIEYVELPICRSRQLLAYFGQQNVRDCGVCDVCVERKTTVSEAEIATVAQKIALLLRYESLSLHEIADAFGDRQRDKVLNVVSDLLNQEILIRLPNGKFYHKDFPKS